MCAFGGVQRRRCGEITVAAARSRLASGNAAENEMAMRRTLTRTMAPILRSRVRMLGNLPSYPVAPGEASIRVRVSR